MKYVNFKMKYVIFQSSNFKVQSSNFKDKINIAKFLKVCFDITF